MADVAWAIAVAGALLPLVLSVARALRDGRVGADAIALLAMGGALALGEYLAGAVVALMLAGGNALEAAAGRRARRSLSELLSRAPRIAHRREDRRVVEVAVDDVETGDIVIVRTGDVVPVDGEITAGRALIDESTLTGEPLPVERGPGGPIRSGAVNAGAPFELRATRPAAQSAYAAIVRLVEAAQHERPRTVRLADRVAGVLLPFTVVIAGAAWAAAGDPVRALAVLVVATPCPLILAVPIALLSGVSRAARRGIVVKGSAALERLGHACTLLVDKTGTLTVGAPRVERILEADGVDGGRLLCLAASVEQLSPHVMAEALVHDAEARGLTLSAPTDVEESPGEGIEGVVEGHRVTVGSPDWLAERGIARGAVEPGGAAMLVGVDGRYAGAVLFGDRPREDVEETLAALRAQGVRHIAMATGDRAAVADPLAARLGLDAVYADLDPSGKLDVLRALQGTPGARPVVVLGDGVNDAPALAAADVGVALAAAGQTVSGETADVVVTVDRLDRVADAVAIARRSLSIARQSAVAGLGLSLVAMAFAALGHISPVAGALLQEGIDVAVILNALRALR